MSTVHIKISNVDFTEVLIQNWSGVDVQVLYPQDSFCAAVQAGSDIMVQHELVLTKIRVVIDYVEKGTCSAMHTHPVDLDLFETVPVFVQATTSLNLELQQPAASRANQVQGVKCGEIIIYPPA